MHEILHIIGFCPDSLTHIDILDFLSPLFSDFSCNFQYFYLYLRDKIKRPWDRIAINLKM